MHRMVRRLDALAPEASEALKIVAYFDVLIAKDAGLDSLLRGAAMLSGGVAGAHFRGRTIRCNSEGRTLSGHSTKDPTIELNGESWRVWLELETDEHPTAELILERLGFGVALLSARRASEHGLDVALDSTRTVPDRLAALANHHVPTSPPLRVIATLPDAAPPPGLSAVLPTRFGLVRATIHLGDTLPAYDGRIGFGLRLMPDQAPESWESAAIALHLTGVDGVRALDATELGAMLALIQSYDPRRPHPDVLALASLDKRSHSILQALVEADSLRSAAAVLAMHHSTVQVRHEALTKTLGYDPRSNLGRMRYIAAELLLRFTDSIPEHLHRLP